MSTSREILSGLGPRLIFIGFLLSFIGFILITIESLNQIPGSSSLSTSTGIVIFIGPIPIVIGSGPQGPILIIAALIIAALMILLTTLLIRSRCFPQRIEQEPD